MRDRAFSSFFLSSPSGDPPLRVGLLLDRVWLNLAQASVIDDIQSSDFAGIELLILNADGDVTKAAAPGHPLPGPGRGIQGDRSRGGGFAWRMYSWLDRRRIRLEH